LIDLGVLPIRSLALNTLVDDSLGGVRLTDIRLVDVGVDESELGLVLLVFDGRLDDLEHGGDTSPTSNHEHVRGESRATNQR
jgi:hypothetical protein